ncbi:hypothetical protein [Tardiphaga sp.]|jgi:hypothetical protein|uniref:hypothetical protein n=1 Tax=Tardiphaga sp. TaxID=1926292 RepID=UPI0037DA22C3
MSKAPAKKTTTETKSSVIKGDASLAEFAPGRWAVILKDEVIDIKQMAPGSKPKLFGLEDSEHASDYSIEQVPETVIIGMVRGGKFESADGFGWKSAEDKAARGSPIGSGAVSLADVGAS